MIIKLELKDRIILLQNMPEQKDVDTVDTIMLLSISDAEKQSALDKKICKEEKLQVIQSQLDDIRSRMQGQQKNIEDTKKITLETYRCFKVMIDTLGSCKTDKEEATPLPFYQRIYNKVASWIRPGLFVFSAVLVVCSVSIFLNVRLAERMQQLQDNDMKYRYLLMQGQADGETFDMLENKFKWQRDNGFIRSLTDSVMDFEYRIQKQAEALERARLLNEQAEQLKKEADKLGKP